MSDTVTVSILLSDVRQILDQELQDGIFNPNLMARHRRMTAILVAADIEIEAQNKADREAEDKRKTEQAAADMDARDAARKAEDEARNAEVDARYFRLSEQQARELASDGDRPLYVNYGPNKIPVIKRVRAEFGLGLREAKAWAERSDLPPIADDFAHALDKLGARIRWFDGPQSN